jgi:hypothetical protein
MPDRILPDEGSPPEPPTPRYPEVWVELGDGNAFAVLGTVERALRRAGVSTGDVSRFHAEATEGNYDHLLTTVMRWVNVQGVSGVRDTHWLSESDHWGDDVDAGERS